MNLTQLLLEADPLRHEESRLETERGRLRSAIASATPTAARESGRPGRARLAALVALSIGGLALAYVSDVPWATPAAAQVRFELRLAEERPVAGLVVAQVENTGQIIYLHPETVVGNDDIAGAAAVNGTAGFAVEVQLLPTGADRLREATQTHIGRPIAILLDGRVAMAPTVRSPIGDSAVITGQLSETEARRIAEGVSRH